MPLTFEQCKNICEVYYSRRLMAAVTVTDAFVTETLEPLCHELQRMSWLRSNTANNDDLRFLFRQLAEIWGVMPDDIIAFTGSSTAGSQYDTLVVLPTNVIVTSE